MPPPPLVKYFGNRTAEFGRPLWEIVLNLKNFGRGRLIVRSVVSEKYLKEPCFYKILSVHPHLIEYPVINIILIIN
jgi:small subunit ribosomal protein S34